MEQTTFLNGLIIQGLYKHGNRLLIVSHLKSKSVSL